MKWIKGLSDVIIFFSFTSILFVLFTGGERFNISGFTLSLQNLYNPIIILIFSLSARIVICEEKALKYLKIIFGMITVMIFAAYLINFNKDPFVFILFYTIASFVFITTAIVILCNTVSNMILRFTSKRGKKKTAGNTLIRLKSIVFGGLVFICLWEEIIFECFTLRMFHPVNLTANVGLILFVFF